MAYGIAIESLSLNQSLPEEKRKENLQTPVRCYGNTANERIHTHLRGIGRYRTRKKTSTMTRESFNGGR